MGGKIINPHRIPWFIVTPYRGGYSVGLDRGYGVKNFAWAMSDTFVQECIAELVEEDQEAIYIPDLYDPWKDLFPDLDNGMIEQDYVGL